MAPSPSAPTILLPAIPQLVAISQADDSTPKAGAKRGSGFGGGRKGAGGSQPKQKSCQKSLMRQVSRTSLLDLHDQGAGISRNQSTGLINANVAELLHSSIHSDEDEVFDVKII